MAESCKIGVLGLWPGPTGLFPARTPGPLGWRDACDPGVSALLGNTPGPLGWRDWADPTLEWGTPWQLPMGGGLCRFGDGQPAALGGSDLLPPEPATKGEVSLAEAQSMALQITTVFEGGKSMNYQALADDFDGQATSFGLIQWNFGQGTLGPLLKKFMANDAASFSACFGADADYDTLKAALDAGNSASQAKWARDLQATTKGKAAWRAAFEALGKVEAFNKIQREDAAAKYHPKVVGCVSKLRELLPDPMKDVSFRTYAALFDLCVQQNNLDKAWDEIKAAVTEQKPQTQDALVRIAVTERAKKASSAWASDCMSRRLGILDGKAFESSENSIKKKRANPQFALIDDHGDKKVKDL